MADADAWVEFERDYQAADRRLREARLVACLKAEWLAKATEHLLAPPPEDADEARIADTVNRQVLARELAHLRDALAKVRAADAEVSAVMERAPEWRS